MSHPEDEVRRIHFGIMTKNYCVYLATNKGNTVLYTGVTNNITRRMYEHKKKLIPGFTARYNIRKLVYYEFFLRPDEAIAAEKKIKGWIRQKKIDLIKRTNPRFEDLTDPSFRLQRNSGRRAASF